MRKLHQMVGTKALISLKQNWSFQGLVPLWFTHETGKPHWSCHFLRSICLEKSGRISSKPQRLPTPQFHLNPWSLHLFSQMQNVPFIIVWCMHKKRNTARILELKREIAAFKLEELSISNYYAKLRAVWRELALYQNLESCWASKLASK